MFDLTDKVALVTGGSRGTGRAIAPALAGPRAQAAVNYVPHLRAAHPVAGPETRTVARKRR